MFRLKFWEVSCMFFGVTQYKMEKNLLLTHFATFKLISFTINLCPSTFARWLLFIKKSPAYSLIPMGRHKTDGFQLLIYCMLLIEQHIFFIFLHFEWKLIHWYLYYILNCHQTFPLSKMSNSPFNFTSFVKSTLGQLTAKNVQQSHCCTNHMGLKMN
jgi:hypothetical protein